ncbi:MAG: LacI family DNA-binding transcriptional regulator [Lachnospiraceae bacterium]|nr:LacI family DNA-binding transcriptional regulator [Lachnospiraceae bacterium]
MGKNITIADVAEELGVSKTTVSRAMSGKGRISEATRQRVKAYMEEKNYKPNIIAQGLAKSKTYNIGVVMPSDYGIEDMSYFHNCLVGLQEMAASYGYDIVLAVCSNNDLGQLKRITSNGKVDGVILMRTLIEDEAVKLLLKQEFPFVVIGISGYNNVIQIEHNHFEGCRELTLMLLMKKLRRIAVIGGSEAHMVTSSRIKGYKAAYGGMDIKLPNGLIYLNQDNPIMIERAVDDIFLKGADCIICMDDAICSVVLNKLRKEDIEVPADIKIASFFDSMILKNNVPAITTLSFDVQEIGKTACKTLIDILEGSRVKNITYLGYKVELKESTR